MKKPQSISLLGNALFTGAQEAGSKRRRDAKKDSIKKKVLKYVFRGAESLGNKVLAKNNEQFLKNENFYARNAIIDANIDEDQKHIDQWNDRLKYKGGEDKYFFDQAEAFYEKLPEATSYKDSKGVEAYNSLLWSESTKLALKMKGNHKNNYTEALSRMNEYGENPKSAYRNEVLKNRSTDVWDIFTRPIVNAFTGQDKREITDITQESIESKGGAGEQGKVSPKDIKNIFGTTGNYTVAMQTSVDIEKARLSFGALAVGLPNKPITYGEFEDVKVVGVDGEEVSFSVRQASIGSTPVNLTNVAGQDVTELVKNTSVHKQAAKVKPSNIQKARVATVNMYNTKEQEMFVDYKSRIINKNEKADQPDAIDSFNQNFYGKISITSDILEDKFGNITGANSEFFINLSAKMHAEDLKLTFNNAFFSMNNEFNRNRSLIAGSNHYDPFVALKALESMQGEGNVAETLLNYGLVEQIQTDLQNNVTEIFKTHTPAQITSIEDLMEQLKITI